MIPDLSVREVRSLNGWADSWDLLVDGAEVPSPFLRSWWVQTLTDDRTLLVLVCAGEELVGGLALQRQGPAGLRTHRLLGDGVLCPDHLDLLAAPGRRDEVVTVLADWLAGQRGLFDLRGVVDGALLARALPHARVDTMGVAPFEELPVDGAAWRDRRSSSVRRRLRRTERSLAGRGVAVRRAAASELPGVLAAFEAMHRVRPDRAPLMREWDDLRRLVEAAVARDEAWVFVAENGQDTVAVLVAFVSSGRICLYQSARRLTPAATGAGIALIAEAVRAAEQAGIGELDLLRGDEDYKRELAGSQRAQLRLVAAHGPVARVLGSVRAGAESTRAALGRLRRRWTRQEEA